MPRDWYIGLWKDVSKRVHCPLCRLVSHTIKINLGTNDFSGLSRCMVSLRRHNRGDSEMDVLLSLRDSFNWERNIQFRSSHRILFAEENNRLEHTGILSRNRSRCIPSRLDLELVKRWIEKCDKHEGCSSDGALFNKPPNDMMVLDVQSLNVIDAPIDCRYLALSYVWGAFDMPEIHWLKDGGTVKASICFEELPKTIQDAITLVQGLNERFLWIDAICINQDDLCRQIAQMGRIYSSALLTVVAAAGRDATAGLPGLFEHSRIPLQRTERIHSFLLRTALSNDNNTIIDNSYWNNRGWTYQERLLSRRCLIFTTYQVYFQCRTEIRSEDTVFGTYLPATIQGWNSWLDPMRLQRTRRFSTLMPFADFLQEYSSRKFTKDYDVIRASLAALDLFSHIYESTFLWGLPESILDRALLWDYHLKTRANYGLDNPRRRHQFPSWSWASWSGVTFYDGNHLTLKSTVSWYKVSINGDLCPIENSKMKRTEQDRADNANSVQRWTPQGFQVDHHILPSCKRARIPDELYTGLLVFWTTTAKLKITPTEASLADLQSPYLEISVLNDDGVRINRRFLIIPRSWWKNDSYYYADFISIAQTNENVFLMLIDWNGDFAFRVGIVAVTRSDWQKFSNRIWKLILLG